MSLIDKGVRMGICGRNMTGTSAQGCVRAGFLFYRWAKGQSGHPSQPVTNTKSAAVKALLAGSGNSASKLSNRLPQLEFRLIRASRNHMMQKYMQGRTLACASN